MTNPTPTDGPQVLVRMLQPLGGHKKYDLVEVDADLVDAYVAAGYVELAD